MSTQDSLGPVSRALEGDLRLWGAESGVLAQTARLFAAGLDSELSVEASRELRLLVKAIREQAAETGAPSEVDRLLAAVRVDGFE